MDLIPVDHDPFAEGMTLHPVDHDPFAEEHPGAAGLIDQANAGLRTQRLDVFRGKVEQGEAQRQADQAAMMPETFANPAARGLVGGLAGMVADPMVRLIDEAANAPPPGLRREDYTDNPSAPQPGEGMRDAARMTALGQMGAGWTGAATKAGDVLLGAGPVRRTAEAAKAGEENVGPGLRPGGGSGAGGLEEAQGAAARLAGTVKPLPDLPQKPIPLAGGTYVPGPNEAVHKVAQDYMASTGRPYVRPDRYEPIDTEHAGAIAKAYEEMQHAPNDPKVKASYNAMIKETVDQYQALKKSGLKIEAIPPGAKDPYAESPRLAHKDVADNNHLWFFPTESGFGSGDAAAASHPMLRKTGEKLDGQPLLANDMFRVVHDYFGHLKEGNGFRAAGEDNAWRTHANMYSDLAKPAMTTETRGQNSWLNYGPHGEFNRTASAADTHYAEQKVGLLPDWTMRDRAPFPQYAEHYPPVGPGVPAVDKTSGKEYLAKQLTPEAEAFQKTRAGITSEMNQKGFEPYFDPGKRTHVDPKNYPPNVDTLGITPAKQTTIDKDMAMIGSKDSRARLQDAYARGAQMPNTKDWYAMGQLEKAFTAELGPKEGRKAFQDKFATSMAATTGGADPQANYLMSQFGNYLRSKGQSYPAAAHEMPFPIGGRYATGNMNMHQKTFDQGGSAALGEGNPKRHNFAQNFTGNRNAATMDEQMTSGMTPGIQMPPPGKYGLYEKVLHEEAAKAGVHPQNFQDVAWAGFKNMKDKKYTEGQPMIQTVNEAIERTHRLTGMPKDEIVRRGIIRGEIPVYGLGGAATLGAVLSGQHEDGGS